jgi:hypothetical protein
MFKRDGKGGFLCLQSFASPLQLNILHETLVFKGLSDLRNTEARAAVWRQIRHYINICLNIVYFNVGVI